MKCPECKNENVTYSRRRGFETVIKYIVPLAPYRCKECWNRFWSFNNPYKTLQSKIILVIILIILIAPFVYHLFEKMEWKVKNRVINKRIDAPLTTTTIPSPPDIQKYFPDPPKVPEIQPQKAIEQNDIHSSSPLIVTTDHSTKPIETSPQLPLSPIPDRSTGLETQKEPIPKDLKESAVTPTTAPIKPPEDTITQKPLISLENQKTNGIAVKEDLTKSQTTSVIPLKRTLTAIRATNTANGAQIFILTNQLVETYKTIVYTENGLLKFYIDIFGKWENNARPLMEIENNLIKRIRTGNYEDKVRVVADLKVNKILPPSITSTEEGLLIKLEKAN